MRTVELLIDEEQKDFGVEAISLVKFPAIEENFVYFNKDQKLTLAKVDEDKRKAVMTSPRDLALALATDKVQAVARNHPHAIVIGGDQLVSLENDVLGKPGTTENAIEQLLRMSGNPHDLITAIAVVHNGEISTHVDETRLWMRSLDRASAERYVLADQPLDCAGAYKIESLGIALFEKIESQDHTAITGLPLIAITRLLSEHGIAIP